MLTIKETGSDGSVRELTFSDKAEAAEALRVAFGIEKSEAQRERETRQRLNDGLREQWRRGSGVSTDDVQKLFDKARHEL